jgi:hypothetical protein
MELRSGYLLDLREVKMETKFEKAIYEACLKSAISMGSRIKTLSWFGKNHGQVKVEDKLAA